MVRFMRGSLVLLVHCATPFGTEFGILTVVLATLDMFASNLVPWGHHRKTYFPMHAPAGSHSRFFQAFNRSISMSFDTGQSMPEIRWANPRPILAGIFWGSTQIKLSAFTRRCQGFAAVHAISLRILQTVKLYQWSLFSFFHTAVWLNAVVA